MADSSLRSEKEKLSSKSKRLVNTGNIFDNYEVKMDLFFIPSPLIVNTVMFVNVFIESNKILRDSSVKWHELKSKLRCLRLIKGRIALAACSDSLLVNLNLEKLNLS